MSTQRTITVVATKGGRIDKVTTDVVTWGDLKALIQDKYDLSNLKAVENVNKTTLEHIDAVLPSGNFRLFLRASKTKSGQDFSTMSFGEMRNNFIKPNEDVKNFLNDIAKKTDRNWTQLKTDELREGLTQFYASHVKSTNEVTEIATVITEEGAVTLNPLGKIKLAKTLIEEAVNEFEDHEDLDSDDFDEVEGRAGDIYDELDSISETLENYYTVDGAVQNALSEETAEQKAAREAEEAEKEDIEREMREIEDGL